MWLKMAEVAKELGVSKDVVKYHRKSISDDFINWKNGEIYISPEGVKWIKSKLKKDTYHANFETYTRAKLKESTGMLDMIYELLQTKLIVEPALAKSSNQESLNLTQLIQEELTEEFIQWYCQHKQIDTWADWQYKFIYLNDFLDYLNRETDS